MRRTWHSGTLDATYHLPSSLLRKHTNLLGKSCNTDDPLPKVDIDASPDTFSDFVDWLYRGPEVIRIYRLPYDVNSYRHLWELADRLQAEELRNQMLDNLQNLPFDDNFISILRSFGIARMGTTALVDYVCDKLAYEIVEKGWAQFIQVGGKSWDDMMRTPIYCAPLTKRVMEKLDGAYILKEQGTLEDPATQMTCKWHEHTKKSKLECPRYQPEPPRKKAKAVAAEWIQLDDASE